MSGRINARVLRDEQRRLITNHIERVCVLSIVREYEARRDGGMKNAIRHIVKQSENDFLLEADRTGVDFVMLSPFWEKGTVDRGVIERTALVYRWIEGMKADGLALLEGNREFKALQMKTPSVDVAHPIEFILDDEYSARQRLLVDEYYQRKLTPAAPELVATLKLTEGYFVTGLHDPESRYWRKVIARKARVFGGTVVYLGPAAYVYSSLPRVPANTN